MKLIALSASLLRHFLRSDKKFIPLLLPVSLWGACPVYTNAASAGFADTDSYDSLYHASPLPGGGAEAPMVNAHTLALRDAVRLALIHHPDIHRASFDVAGSAEKIDIAEAGWYPKLQYGAEPGFGASDTSTQRSVGITQPLYDFGRTSGQVDSSKATLTQKQHQYDATLEKVAYEASETYLDLVAAQAMEEAAHKLVKAQQQTRQRIESRLRAGLSLASDLNLADIAVQRALTEEYKAATHTEMAQKKLSRLTGGWSGEVMSLPHTRTFIQNIKPVAPAIEQAPQVLAAKSAEAVADADVKVAQAEYWPTISVGARTAKVKGEYVTSNNQWLGISIDGTLPLSGVNQHRTAVAVAEKNAAAASFDDQVMQTRIELDAAATEKQGALARTASLQHVIAITIQSRDLLWQEYTLNHRQLTDVINAEREIYQAVIDYTEASHDGLLADLRIFSTTGQLVQVLKRQPEQGL